MPTSISWRCPPTPVVEKPPTLAVGAHVGVKENRHGRKVSITIRIALALLGLSRPFFAQEPVGRRILSRNELRDGFAKILPALADANWQSYFKEPDFQKEEAQAMSLALKMAPANVETIFASKAELTSPFFASMTVGYQALSDLHGSWSAGKLASRPLYGRARGATIDLRVKADFLARHNSSRIPVSVRTLKPGTAIEVHGCYVWYAPYFDDREAYWERFGPISSPSRDELSPGTYVVWSKKENRTGKRERLTVDAGARAKAFDIDAPE